MILYWHAFKGDKSSHHCSHQEAQRTKTQEVWQDEWKGVVSGRKNVLHVLTSATESKDVNRDSLLFPDLTHPMFEQAYWSSKYSQTDPDCSQSGGSGSRKDNSGGDVNPNEQPQW